MTPRPGARTPGTGARVSAVLEHQVFPDSADRLTGSTRTVLVGTALGGLGVVASLFRHGSDAWTTVWAEDGEVFLADALRLGPIEAILEPYAGYAHTIPRLVAEAVSVFPLGYADTLLAVAGAALSTLSAMIVYVASAGHVHSRPLRAVLAATVLLVPTAGTESPNSVAYAQWYLLAAAIWLSLWRPATWRSGAAGGAFLLLVALSTPVTALLLPVLLLRAVRAWVARSARDAALVTGGVVGIGAQLLVVALAGETGAKTAAPGNVLEAVLLRITGPLVPGPAVTRDLWLWLGDGAFVPLGLLALGLVAVMVVGGDTRVRLLATTAMVGVFAVLLLADLTRGAVGGLVWPADLTNELAGRYTIVPVVLVVSALLVRADLALRRASPARAPAITVASVAIVALAVGAGYRVDGETRARVAWGPELDAARAACASAPDDTQRSVPISPGHPFALTTTCGRLR